MIRTTVIVEGNRLDLAGDVATDFTYSISDIREPESRRTDFSKTIELPGTPRNNALFAQLFDVNIENDWTPAAPNIGYNFNPNKVAKALILLDGIEIFRGVIRVMKVRRDRNKITYETNVLGRLADILFAFGDKKLSNIDFSDLDHVLDVAHLEAVWNNPGNYRYAYPLMDYGYSLDGTSFPIQNFAPAIYVKEYIDRMFTAAGFTYNCPFFSQPYFQSLIVPVTTKYDVGSPAGDVNYLELQSVTEFQQNNRTNNWREVTVPFKTEVVDKYGWHVGTNNHIVFTANIDVSFRVSLNFRYDNAKNRGAELFILKNNDSNNRLVVESIPANQQYIKVVELQKQHFEPGDVLTVSVNLPPRGRVQWSGQDTWRAPSPADESQYPIDVGAQVRMFDVLAQDISQKDFFKSILLMHNLYLYTDESNDKNLFIVPQAWFYDTFAGNAVDWTYKMDHSKEVEITPMGELAAREYLLTYKKDADYYNDQRYFKIYGEVYGQRSAVADNDFEKDTKKIELVFSPTPPVQLQGSTRVMPHFYKVNKDGAKERDAFNIRILQYGGLKPSQTNSSLNAPYAPWNVTDFNGNFLKAFNFYPYAGMWDDPQALSRDLCFGPPREVFFFVNPYPDVTLYRYWWAGFINEITNKDSKLVRAYFNLSPADINQLDFKRLVKVDNTYYKLNKIDQFNPLAKSMTRVELFKTAIKVEVERPGFLKWSDDGYLLHSDESPARTPIG